MLSAARGGWGEGELIAACFNLEEPVRVASPHRINLEEPVRVASPTRINLEKPVRVASPTRIKSFLCLSVSPSVCE